jgi:photosystem II stability/assembly factor-like uncharacterized protein
VSAVLETGELYSSADGGESWTVTACEPAFHFRAVRFANADDGWAIGDSLLGAPVVARTHDGGAAWTVRAVDLPPTPRIGRLQDLRFWDGRDGVAVADYGVLLTNDGGAAWRTSAPAGFRGTTTASAFGDGRLVWLNEYGSGGGRIYRSLDGGETWQTLNATITGSQTALPPLREVRFFAAGFGLGIGPGERLYVTRDGGETWQETAPGGAVRPLWRAVLVTGSASAVVLERGRDGALYETRDAAQTWAKVGSEPLAFACSARFSARTYAGASAATARFSAPGTAASIGNRWVPSAPQRFSQSGSRMGLPAGRSTRTARCGRRTAARTGAASTPPAAKS